MTFNEDFNTITQGAKKWVDASGREIQSTPLEKEYTISINRHSDKHIEFKKDKKDEDVLKEDFDEDNMNKDKGASFYSGTLFLNVIPPDTPTNYEKVEYIDNKPHNVYDRRRATNLFTTTSDKTFIQMSYFIS